MKLINKARLPMLIAIVILAIVIFSLVKGLNRESAGNTDGYVTITSVPGISFDVKKSFADAAQAVLEISENVTFLDYMTYTYKNGTDTYLIFNIRSYIVIAKKGTQFKLSSGTDELKYSSLNGIWFTPTDKVQKNGDRYEVPVTAEVVITNKVYNDYKGILTTIESNGEEWSVFAGVTGKTEESCSMHTASSMVRSDNQDIIGETMVVDLGDTGPMSVNSEKNPSTETEEPSVEIKEPDKEPAEEPAEEPIEEPIKEPLKEPTEEPAKEPEPAPEPVEEPEPMPVDVIEEPEPMPEQPITVTDNGKETFKIKSNQQKIERDEDKAYSSTIYSMLAINDIGYTVIRSDSADFKEVYIKPTKILNEKEAYAKIQQYINRGYAYYDKVEVPKGSHIEACVYNVKFDSEDTYLNILIKGLDGEKLVYQGIAYSPRTYDIYYETKTGWNENRIVYYFVPNGCTEYVLQFGDGNGEKIQTCYYKIG